MECPRCGKENADKAKFCRTCSITIVTDPPFARGRRSERPISTKPLGLNRAAQQEESNIDGLSGTMGSGSASGISGAPPQPQTQSDTSCLPPPEIPVGPARTAFDGNLPAKGCTLSFSFSGKASEYFGIWIVNILLTVLTLGIYSAWAKVRKRQYFYANTLLNDVPFDYLASPIAILKGWLIAVGLFLCYSLANHFYPKIAIALFVVFLLILPWLVVRSRIFSLRNSAHRNIRFNFRPNYRDAYVSFLGLYLLVPFTLGLIAPYVVYRQRKFLVENSAYGQTFLSFDGRVGEFYRMFLRAAGFFVLIIATFVLISLLAGGAKGFGASSGAMGALGIVGVIAVLASIVLYFLMIVYVRTELSNLTWNNARIGDNRFSSNLRTLEMARLYFSNIIAIVLSLGFLIPWAMVRTARYRLENLSLLVNEDLEGFVAAAHQEVGSAGEEISDVLGIDVAL